MTKGRRDHWLSHCVQSCHNQHEHVTSTMKTNERKQSNVFSLSPLSSIIISTFRSNKSRTNDFYFNLRFRSIINDQRICFDIHHLRNERSSMINHDGQMFNVQTTKLIDFRSSQWWLEWWWSSSMVTCMRLVLFRVVRHWRGGVIVRIRIITTFNLPSMYWWRWRTMNINDWCSWCCHNLELNERKKNWSRWWRKRRREKNDEQMKWTLFSLAHFDQISSLLFSFSFLFSSSSLLSLVLLLFLFRFLSLPASSLSCPFHFEAYVHHLWLKKDRWISTYLLLDFVLM